MRSTYPRPFECGNTTFINSVLNDHVKTPIQHNTMVTSFFGLSNPTPAEFLYSEHDIPEDCNAHLVEITFDPAVMNNSDIRVNFIPWDQTKPDPVSVSGRVYYSLIIFNGLRTIKNASRLQLRKAIESTPTGDVVSVVLKAFKSDGTVVYHGDLTSQIPLHIGNFQNPIFTGNQPPDHMKTTCGTRPFNCGDSQFMNCVLNTHEITASQFNKKVKEFMGDLLREDYIVDIEELGVPEGEEDCDDYLWELRYDPAKKHNNDITFLWAAWPQSDPRPQSGCVYYSIPLITALRTYYGGVQLRLTKAFEVVGGDKIVALAFKAYDSNGTLVYIGNLTSQIPKTGSDSCLP